MVKGRACNGKKQNPVMKASPLPEPADVIHAVQSLYEDQIRPNGRLLRKRLMEVHAAQGPWDVDVKKLLQVCSRISEFEVQFDGQDDWSVLLVGRQCNFVDIPSLEDTYPQELWCSFREYFEEQKGLSLPGGRYECARALSLRNLPFLAGYSLGQVCHMVQLAISTKKILGYNLSTIVAYGCSQSMEKEQCAASNVACSGRDGRSAGMPALSWEEARFYLQELLSSSPPTGIQLPNVKRLFKSRFNANLSETALGYSKVSDLLQDPHFQDICVVKEHGQGYVVMQAPAQAINLFDLLSANVSPAKVQEQCVTADKLPEHVSSFDVEPLSFDEAELQNEPLVLVPTPSPSPGLPTWALSPATWAKNGYAGVVHNTFIDLKLPKTPLLRSERRSQTEPHNIGLKEDWTDEVNGQYDDSTSEGSRPTDASAPSSREESPNEKILKQDGLVSGSSVRIVVSDFDAMQDSGLCQERVHFCPNEPLCFDDCTPMTAPNPSPIPSFMETPTPSKTPGILRKHGEARGDKVRKTLRFSIQEDLIEAPPVKADISVFQSVWTPGTCLKQGIREHNTFVDVAMPPLTPLGPAVRRAKSCDDIRSNIF
mmetsp:Transcript_112454/g.206398  ORF Transcript_112454/g.206398 Transcript_112454/m.206398 type:complete len:597 (+) Transcript_112454:100-1890(+)